MRQVEAMAGKQRERRRNATGLFSGSGLVGLALVAVVFIIAVFGPWMSPYSISETVPGLPGSGPSADALLGTDYIGRDVLSRTLHGGLSVLLTPLAATLLAYTLGTVTGLIAGHGERTVDMLLSRATDLLISIPSVIMLLVLIASLGTGTAVLIGGVTLVLLPGIIRLVRSATLEVASTGYVEAAMGRGERAFTTTTREILPNIIQYVLTDFGLRFSGAVILVASVNFLGLGVTEPAADWGVMISTNRVVMSTNVWSVLAPAILLGALTIGVNLMVDAYGRGLARRSGR